MNDGGPAFPGFQYTEGHGSLKISATGPCEVYDRGMTLRDYFAAHAPENCGIYLVGWVFAEPMPEPPVGYRERAIADQHSEADVAYERAYNARSIREQTAFHVAARYAYADAMLAARESK